MNEKERELIPETGFPIDEETPFLFREKIAEAQQVLNRRLAVARIMRRERHAHIEEVAPGVSITIPELEAEKRAGTWEEERDKGWNENIKPGASVQWYQEGSRSPNLGEVLEIDPEYQTYKVRDAYTGEVSVQTRVKIFSKKVSGFCSEADLDDVNGKELILKYFARFPEIANQDVYMPVILGWLGSSGLQASTAIRLIDELESEGIVKRIGMYMKILSEPKKTGELDPKAPANALGQSQMTEYTPGGTAQWPWALFEQNGKYYKVPLDDLAKNYWGNSDEIDWEELQALKGEEPMMGFAEKRAAVDETLVAEAVQFLEYAYRSSGIEMTSNRELFADVLHAYLVDERGLDVPDDQFDEILPVVFKRLRLKPKNAAGSWEMSDEKKLFDYYRQARDSGAPLDTLEDFRNAIPDPTWKKYLPLDDSTYPQFKIDADAYADHASDWMEKGYESGRIAAFEESKHPRDEGGQFGSGGGEDSGWAEPGSDEFMQRMLEVGPGPGDKVRLKDGTETEWSEDVHDQIDAFMPEMGPQQWFANQEKPKRKSRKSSKFAEERPSHGLIPWALPFATLNEVPGMPVNRCWKLAWLYDDGRATPGEGYFPNEGLALEHLDKMAEQGLIRVAGVREKSVLEYPEEMGGGTLKPDECPACSGQGEEIGPGVYMCKECQGLFGQVASEQEALQWVNFREWDDSPDTDNQRYFDFSWPGGRVHGWYNEATGKMTQSG